MDFRKEKIRVMIEKMKSLTLISEETITYSYLPCPEYKTDNCPPPPSSEWLPYQENILFSGIDNHYWLHMQVKTGPAEDGKEPRLLVKTGREGEWDATNPQFTVFLNGETVQALDTNHTWMPLEYGRAYDVYLYLYTGMKEGNFETHVSLATADLRIENLYYDLLVPYQVLNETQEGTYEYVLIRDCLDKSLLNLDLRHSYSAAFYTGIRKTSEYLKKEFYEKLCGKETPTVSCIGHTHIDVAWLWTVAQTREKAQRSFSTVLSLMKRYPEYLFMSSQPQLYQYVKEVDPTLYARIKDAVKAGKWEVEGAMWLEADTNLISGESLIRQILHGKKFMREEFGAESTILWLPDVFGYSGALPQIMKKCGVDRFFTAKMCWNETNKMPNDTFIWEGIDGSCVLASTVDGYVHDLNAHEVKTAWDGYKNKSYSNHVLLTCGFGDGGGGTTYEMMEIYSRLQHGLPGMPRAKMEKAGTYFDRLELDFKKNAAALGKEPKWKGEMYLEMHRGTYTSIAKNKKNNRKSELLYLKAETLSVIDMLLNQGQYPDGVIQKNTVRILLNQFHDIIPGSSIKEVYDVSDLDYADILEDGKAIVKEKLAAIRRGLNTDGGLFVYNPTPFAQSRYITCGQKTYFAENVPAHGWRVVPAEETSSGILVKEKTVENDRIKVSFNDRYHIISVYDKEERRELIPEGEEAGRLEVYEDYPRAFDAWEISDYYTQKRWLADEVDSTELLPNGIRVKRRYQTSTISQDIVLTRGSKRIDFVTDIDWHEDHVLLKAVFPVDILSMNATYDIQFGNIERPTHRNTSWDAAKFEVCAHKWADLSEADYGVSILSDCKYGFSVEGNVMTLSLLKAATYPNPEADRGSHSFTYSLYPHTGDFRTGKTIPEGYLLNNPLDVEMVGKKEGDLPETYSLISCKQENIVVETIKKAEGDQAVIVRLYDSFNQKTNAELRVSFPFARVYLCDMLENRLEELGAQNGTVYVPVKNFEIITLRFEQSGFSDNSRL